MAKLNKYDRAFIEGLSALASTPRLDPDTDAVVRAILDECRTQLSGHPLLEPAMGAADWFLNNPREPLMGERHVAMVRALNRLRLHLLGTIMDETDARAA